MVNLTVGIPYTDDTEPGNKTENGENKRNKKQRTVRRLGLPRLKARLFRLRYRCGYNVKKCSQILLFYFIVLLSNEKLCLS